MHQAYLRNVKGPREIYRQMDLAALNEGVHSCAPLTLEHRPCHCQNTTKASAAAASSTTCATFRMVLRRAPANAAKGLHTALFCPPYLCGLPFQRPAALVERHRPPPEDRGAAEGLGPRARTGPGRRRPRQPALPGPEQRQPLPQFARPRGRPLPAAGPGARLLRHFAQRPHHRRQDWLCWLEDIAPGSRTHQDGGRAPCRRSRWSFCINACC